MWTETDAVSETLFSSCLEFRKMDKVQKSSDSEFYNTMVSTLQILPTKNVLISLYSHRFLDIVSTIAYRYAWKWWIFGLKHRIVWQVVTNFSEERIGTIFGTSTLKSPEELSIGIVIIA
jgi:hypothetical protein